MNKLIDFYLNNAIKSDILIVGLIWIANSCLRIIDFIPASKEIHLSILSDLISASISLAGFILASLTIIAAIKSNISNKAPETAKNPLELFFSPKNYKRIVEVFQGSIIELTFTFILAYFFWISSENFSNETIHKIVISLSVVISISTLRSLIVLFRIIRIEE
ncbi:hypothetical protein [Flavobacterium saliperosum]|uniref:Uncharacterized protein n=1 Tax=Flavobacterium saliperosum TaxID=329186 RepID=A0A1G4W5L6_9FLAO|nr:hypothetical protein [Flavobacterium saliperosum]SCX17133.1 hypothetical protein SAMN02927925_02493 [Flavobacterium saliperosum]